jgi:type II secretion system protein I
MNRRRGFTLLELMVAAFILGLAVVGLLSNISASLRNAGRLTDYDRAVLVAGRKMNELLLDPGLPRMGMVEGKLTQADSAGLEGGWRAELTPFETPPQRGPGAFVLERLQLEVWWMRGANRRSLTLEGYRRVRIETPQAASGVGP